MKQLLAGIVLIVVLAVLGFLYRNAIERPIINVPPGTNTPGNTQPNILGTPQACTEEARVCPDGSAVGRTGPNCAFAACAAPNTSLTVGSTTLGFVLPAGYHVSTASGQVPNPSLLGVYEKPSTSGTHLIRVYEYPTLAGQTGEKVMLSNAVLSPSGMNATSTAAFKTMTQAGNNFYSITTERFEGQVETSYFLIRSNDVLRFDLVEKDVNNWTNPQLNVSALPEHQALLHLLSTLQIGSI